MADERPWNWEWVKAINTCNAQVMFGALKTTAERDVAERNRYLEKQRYNVRDVNGITFLVERIGQTAHLHNVVFVLTDDLKNLKIVFGDGLQRKTLLFETHLNEVGICKWRLDGDGHDLEAWQVLRDALERLLFE